MKTVKTKLLGILIVLLGVGTGLLSMIITGLIYFMTGFHRAYGGPGVAILNWVFYMLILLFFTFVAPLSLITSGIRVFMGITGKRTNIMLVVGFVPILIVVGILLIQMFTPH